MKSNIRRCPHCGSEDYEYVGVDSNDCRNELYDMMRCESCGKKYTLVYRYAETVKTESSN